MNCTGVNDVAEAFVDLLEDRYKKRVQERFTLVLSGGATARACYERAARLDIDWNLVDIYMGDERWVSPLNDDANEKLVRETLVERIASVGSFHPMLTEATLDECVRAYAHTIEALINGPGIDLIHLGMGPDGHTASLFPHAPALDALSDQLVIASEDPNGINPHKRISLTMPAINSARLAVFTVAGVTKAPAIAALLRGEDLPASHVKAAEVRWLVDREALGSGGGDT